MDDKDKIRGAVRSGRVDLAGIEAALTAIKQKVKEV